MQYSYGVTAAISFVEWNCYDYIHSNTSIQPSRFSAGYIYTPHLRVFRQASVSQRRNRKLPRIQGRTFLTIWALVTGANCFLPFSSFYSSTVDSQISSSEYLFATELIAYDLIISLEWEEKLFVLRRQSINHNWEIQRRTFIAGNSALRGTFVDSARCHEGVSHFWCFTRGRSVGIKKERIRNSTSFFSISYVPRCSYLVTAPTRKEPGRER